VKSSGVFLKGRKAKEVIPLRDCELRLLTSVLFSLTQQPGCLHILFYYTLTYLLPPSPLPPAPKLIVQGSLFLNLFPLSLAIKGDHSDQGRPPW